MVLGDSHCLIFKSRRLRDAFPKIFFHVTCVQGATASGLDNPNSKTKAYPTFKKALESYNGKTVITLLGEVDTGFVIWYWAQKHSYSIKQSLERAATTYCRFLDEVGEKFNVVCISAPLPTISDNNNWGKIANLRKEVTASQRQRTLLTLAFNSLISDHCNAKRYRFVSLDDDSMGIDGLVKNALLHQNPSNHHYDEVAYSNLIIKRIKYLFHDL